MTKTATINGEQLKEMLTNGCRNLLRHENTVNNLNVFPVPDGDTGTNMTKTIVGGLSLTPDGEASVARFMKHLSKGTLLSARGNSGVIFSQYIRGIAKGVEDIDEISVADFAKALKDGADRAYKTISTPVEGTMLTVMKDSANSSLSNIESFDCFEDFIDRLVIEAKDSLDKTPELLPVLKDAGVIDSGGAGVFYFFRGMQMYMHKEIIDENFEESEEVSFNAENSIDSANEKKKYGVAAVASGHGIAEYFKEIGVDAIVDGGQTNNPSASDFIMAFERVNAEHIAVLPNNSNVILAARQAAKIYKKANVRVISTKSVAEGYSALSMMNLFSDSIDEFIESMTSGLDSVTTGYVTTATRDAQINGVNVIKGHYIGLDNDRIISCEADKISAVVKFLEGLEDIDDKEVITVFYGKDVTEENLEELESIIADRYPMVELGYIFGGQEVYSFIFAVE